MTPAVRALLGHYAGEPAGVLVRLATLLGHGRLAGTGKLMVFPVDQGVEHGPVRSFAVQPAAYDPLYHVALAHEAGCSAYVAPLGAMQLVAGHEPGALPTILKLNGSESLSARDDKESTPMASVRDALRLGCTAVGLTIYPGSKQSAQGYAQAREWIAEARAVGMPSIVWAYPRGQGVSAAGESALDVVAYAAHLACQLGAHVVKVKAPSVYIEQPEAKKALTQAGVATSTLAQRIAYVRRACFDGRRLLLVSGGPMRDEADLLAEIEQLARGGADGSIVARNAFQRPRADAVALLQAIMRCYERPAA